MSHVIEKLKAQYTGKNVLVAGLGIQAGGAGVAKFFVQLGAHVSVTDMKNEVQLSSAIETLKDYPIRYILGKHDIQDFLSADVIFKNPAIPWTNSAIAAAVEKNIPVEMEVSFFAAHCPAQIIGITGTRGKSTTTQMIYDLMKKTGYSVYAAGNLGKSSIALLHHLTEKDYVVLELSSWQLSGFHRRKVSPHISVFTNFYPDHLNYYTSMDDYFLDKRAIYEYQNEHDFLVANIQLQKDIEKIHSKAEIIYYEKNDFPVPLEFLKGEHNQENAAAVLHVAQLLGIDKQKAVQIISDFKGLEYRQQVVLENKKMIVINNTVATTPVPTQKAIETFSDKPIVLILGGNSKNLPFDQLILDLKKVEKIVLLKGGFTDEILPELQKKYPEKLSKIYEDLQQAVQEAVKCADAISKQCYILFSPAATSFAMFRNEFHRGEEFNRIVTELFSLKTR